MSEHDPKKYARCRAEEGLVKLLLSAFFTAYLAGLAVFVAIVGDF